MNLKLRKKENKWYHITYSTLKCFDINTLKSGSFLHNIHTDEQYKILDVLDPYVFVAVKDGLRERIRKDFLDDYIVIEKELSDELEPKQEETSALKQEKVSKKEESKEDDIFDPYDEGDGIESGEPEEQNSHEEKTEAEKMLAKIRGTGGVPTKTAIPTGSFSGGGTRSLSDIKDTVDPYNFKESDTTLDNYMEELADMVNGNVIKTAKKLDTSSMSNFKGITKPVMTESPQFSSNLVNMIGQLDWSTVSKR